MQPFKQMAAEAAAFIRSRIETLSSIGILTGTGLGDIAESMVPESVLEYGEIPHFPMSTVVSHTGRLLAGKLGGRPVIALQGRFHLYEGYAPVEVVFPVRVMQEIGVKVLIVTNAAGGLNPAYRQGDIMLLVDHINLTGANPLVGPNEETWGTRFPDMTQVYDRSLVSAAETAGSGMGCTIRKGTYAGLLGPSLETPAETRFLRIIGADAVGLSTVMEAIAAVHAGMRVLGVSVIANVIDPDAPRPVSAEAVVAAAQGATPNVAAIIRRVVESNGAQ